MSNTTPASEDAQKPKTEPQGEAAPPKTPDAFTKTILRLAEGEAHRELTNEMAGLIKKLRDHCRRHMCAAKGGLKLKLNVHCNEEAMISITYEVDVTTPKPHRRGSMFWSTRDGNLTDEIPRQLNLGEAVELHNNPAAPKEVT